MIYSYSCTHEFPNKIQINIEADSEEEALEAAIDEFYVKFEDVASISMIVPDGKLIQLYP